MRLTTLGKVDSIYDIPPAYFAQNGYTLVLADLDNTLAAYGEAEPSEALRDWVAQLQAHGTSLFVLSNSRSRTRAPLFCHALDVPFLAHAGKPNPKGYASALRQMNVSPAQAVMLGDQIFTDMLGAWRADIAAILLKPIRLAGNPGRYLRYAAELPVRALTKPLIL